MRLKGLRTFYKSENDPTHSILIVTVKDLIGRFSETFCYVLFSLQHFERSLFSLRAPTSYL